MKLTYVRWSMTMIEAGDVTIVTDPVFRMMGIRQAPRSFTFDRMPRPDLVFISHTHLDHYEPATLRRLDPDTPVWMPAEKLDTARRLGLHALRGLEAWETDTFRGLRLTAVPAKHSSPELGLVVEADRTVYFAGDTSLDRELFQAIARRWKLDAVLLPVGDLRTLGLPVGHIGLRQAARALRLLGEPQVVVPTHYSGMTLGPLVYFAGKPRRLGQALEKAGLGTIIGARQPLQTAQV